MSIEKRFGGTESQSILSVLSSETALSSSYVYYSSVIFLVVVQLLLVVLELSCHSTLIIDPN